MEHQQKGIAKKIERHYRESRLTIAIWFIMLGIVMLFVLSLVWSQYLFPRIFNSRLLFNLIIDKEDYTSCNTEFKNFIINQDSLLTSMFSFYIFNITNPADVMERGNRPDINQLGPYSYTIQTYKYDVAFDQDSPSTINYKEYSNLRQITPKTDQCKRPFLQDSVTCSDPTLANSQRFCECQDHNDTITVINPLFAKTLWLEGGTQMISYLSQEVFENIKNLLENDFIEAVQLTSVPRALGDIIAYRKLAQDLFFIQVSYSFLASNGYASSYLFNNLTVPTTCGLSSYSISSCPWRYYYSSLSLAQNQAIITYTNQSLNATDFPSLYFLFDSLNTLSFLHTNLGFPNWVGISYYLGNIYPTILPSLVSATNEELSAMYDRIVNGTLAQVYPSGNYTHNNYLATRSMIDAISAYLSAYWFNSLSAQAYTQLKQEYLSQPSPVPCSPTGKLCVWQWGYTPPSTTTNNTVAANLTTLLLDNILDISLKAESNLNSIYMDMNLARVHNTFTYCSQLVNVPSDDQICLDKNYTVHDARSVQPAAMWAGSINFFPLDENDLLLKFSGLPVDLQLAYYDMACSYSISIFQTYLQSTDFNIEYTVKYLNAYKESALNYTFSVENITDLGYAQFGSGAITYALMGVRSIAQVTRNAFWRFGDSAYIGSLLELSSWSIVEGFGQARIYDIDRAREVLHTLACITPACRDLRSNISYISTTFIGDNVHFINGVGKVGDYAFTTENNNGYFLCDVQLSHVCEILNTQYVSSYNQCLQIESLYTSCRFQVLIHNYWVTNCELFQTSISNPTDGIVCSTTNVLTHAHPYQKSFGNIVNNMMNSLTIQLVAENGLVCSSPTGCFYNLGGAFITTTVRALLFEGYTDPFVLKYLNTKHKIDNITFSCLNIQSTTVVNNTTNSTSACQQIANNYKCSKMSGVRITYPTGELQLTYGFTNNKLYFSSYFYFDANGTLLLPENNTQNYALKIMNPIFAAYPAWNSEDTEFLKYYQCQGRVLFGSEGQFESCETTLNSGTADYKDILNIKKFKGNSTVVQLSSSVSVTGSVDDNTQVTPYLWDAFESYPYPYLSRLKGSKFLGVTAPVVFDKLNTLHFTYSQTELLVLKRLVVFDPQQIYQNTTSTDSIHVQRFTEDQASWTNAQLLQGTARDSYGMPYKTPIGMASIEHLTGFPVFMGTPNNYGNQQWGGFEYDEVTGATPNPLTQRSFVDMDSISGRGYRKVNRKQISLRLERGPLLENLVSSGDRCVSPTKNYARGSGFGCTLYTPLLWTEEARVMPPQDYEDFYTQFYLMPNRSFVVMVVGGVLGGFFILLGVSIYVYEDYYRRRFFKRIYID